MASSRAAVRSKLNVSGHVLVRLGGSPSTSPRNHRSISIVVLLNHKRSLDAFTKSTTRVSPVVPSTYV